MKYRTFSPVFGLALTVVLTLAGAASAQNETCACEVENTGSGLQGLLSNVSGRVLRSAEDGFVPASTGDAITQSTRLLSGPDGAGTVVFGETCSVELSQNGRLSIAKQGSTYCVSFVQNSKIVPDKAVAGTSTKVAAGAGMAAALTSGGGGAVAALVGLVFVVGAGSAKKSP